MYSYEQIRLWPEGAPTQSGLSGAETQIDPGFVGNITDPHLFLYPAPKPNGQAVVLCPGGGFLGLVLEQEGHAFAEWFNSRGVTLGVLKYRMPNGHREVPLDDLHQALRLLRQRSQTLGVRSLGVMGASAGGYMAATAAVFAQADAKPDFQILLYPAISLKEELSHPETRERLLGAYPSGGEIAALSPEDHVTFQTPPAFITLAGDDRTVNPENSLIYYRALLQKGVPAALHIYPRGGHSFALRDTFRYKAQWTGELERWLQLIAP